MALLAVSLWNYKYDASTGLFWSIFLLWLQLIPHSTCRKSKQKLLQRTGALSNLVSVTIIYNSCYSSSLIKPASFTSRQLWMICDQSRSPPGRFLLIINPTTCVAHGFLHGSAGITLCLASCTCLRKSCCIHCRKELPKCEDWRFQCRLANIHILTLLLVPQWLWQLLW